MVATEFLERTGAGHVPCRFDVVVVSRGTPPRLEVYTNAFGG
jgi:Holliday junction resolvase-like predicted endonuclease